MKNNVLIIGGGGREHALAWKLFNVGAHHDAPLLYIAPGNAGTSQIAQNVPLDITNHKQIIDFVKEKRIGMVIVAPDDPLAHGLVNDLQKAGIKAFGPTKEASEIEWSKSFAKKLMKEEGIPTAKYEEFTDFQKAKNYLKKQNFPVVIKADGLALGKGVAIVNNYDKASRILEEMMVKKIYGKAGDKIVIEEFLTGVEISIHAFSDGKTSILFPSSKDHKAIYDGNKGPNTGGMGTIAAVPGTNNKLMEQINKTIVLPTLKGLKKRGRKFVGILYPGLMITKEGPKVLEFNARFGDPETEVYMRLLETDLLDIFNACVDGKLENLKIKWKKKYASCVILASRGYPISSEKGIEIKGINECESEKDIVVFHAATKKSENKIVTNGGRVLGVTSIGNTLEESLKKTYHAIKKIKFDGMQFRLDIGKYTLL